MKTAIVSWSLPLLLVAGCSGQESAPAEQASAPTEASSTPAPVESAAAVPDVDMCELLPADVVATALDAGAKRQGISKDYADSHGCEYQLDPSGAGNFEYAAVWIMPPSLHGDLSSALDTASGLGQQAHGETVDGLGDQAWLMVNDSEQQSTVHVLQSGKVAIEASAGTPEHARTLAEMALKVLAQRQ